MNFNSGPKVPFPGVLDIGQFHSPQMKPCKSPDYFIKVSFHIVVDMRQGESNIFQISTWKAFLLLKINLSWKIRPISVKRCKTVRGSVPTQFPGPIVLLVNLQRLAIVRLNVGTSDCESRTFFIMNFLNFWSESRKARKLQFETQITAIKQGWDSHSRRIYFISAFS